MTDVDTLAWEISRANMIAVDPGQLNVGVSAWLEGSDGWQETACGIMTPDEFADAVAEGYGDEMGWGATKYVVVEDFRLDHSRNSGGSRMIASEVIGMARVRAKMMYGCEFVRQAPEAYKVAALHAGVELPKGHCPDDLSAHLHGFYFLESRGFIKPMPPA